MDRGLEWEGAKSNLIADLEEGVPFADRSVDVLNASHIFEHINNFIPLMNECWRILKDDGFMMVAVPLFPSTAAVGPPDHVRYFTPETFECFTKSWCPPGRMPWILEFSVDTAGPYLGASDEPSLFVMLRPDRGEND